MVLAMMEPFHNPLTPRSDKQLFSPISITPKANIEVMRIKEMITN